MFQCIDCIESAVAEEAVQKCNLVESQDATASPTNTGYHRQCYSHFTNITKIKRAQRTKEREDLLQEASNKSEYKK